MTTDKYKRCSSHEPSQGDQVNQLLSLLRRSSNSRLPKNNAENQKSTHEKIKSILWKSSEVLILVIVAYSDISMEKYAEFHQLVARNNPKKLEEHLQGFLMNEDHR